MGFYGYEAWGMDLDYFLYTKDHMNSLRSLGVYLFQTPELHANTFLLRIKNEIPDKYVLVKVHEELLMI